MGINDFVFLMLNYLTDDAEHCMLGGYHKKETFLFNSHNCKKSFNQKNHDFMCHNSDKNQWKKMLMVCTTRLDTNHSCSLDESTAAVFQKLSGQVVTVDGQITWQRSVSWL